MELLALPFIFLVFLMVPLLLLLCAFWIWMLIDCVQNESSQGNDKVAWILILVLAGWVGAIIYYFVQRPKRFQRQTLSFPPPPLPGA